VRATEPGELRRQWKALVPEKRSDDCGKPSLQRQICAAVTPLDDGSNSCAGGTFVLIVCATCGRVLRTKSGWEFVLILAAACSRYSSLTMKSPMENCLELSV